MDRASARATGSGRAIARFFGNSSPNTICTTVANSSASTVPTATPNPAGTPTPPSSSPIPSPISGSAMYPTIKPVTVIPSCAPDNMNEVRVVMSSARRAPASPSAARAFSRDRSTAM